MHLHAVRGVSREHRIQNPVRSHAHRLAAEVDAHAEGEAPEGAASEQLIGITAAGSRPNNLITRLVAGGSDTRAISKGVCAAMLGNATTLIQ
jgi:hypothetical protein